MKKRLLFVPILCASVFAFVSHNSISTTAVKAEGEEDSALWSEDFANPSHEFDDSFEVEDGIAYPLVGSGNERVFQHDFDPSDLVESNNYSLSFDLELLDTDHETFFYLHFLNMTSTGSSVYTSIERNGQWVVISAVDGGTITSGAGNSTTYKDGSVNNAGVDFSKGFVHVEYIHYETILETYINGVRYAVQSLQNIGNNKWDEKGRVHYEEGKITGFLMHWRDLNQTGRTYGIDNIVWKEVKKPGGEVKYTTTVDKTTSKTKFFNNEICGNLLGNSSYSIEAKFEKTTNPLGTQNFGIEMIGLNGLTGKALTNDHYSVDFIIEVSATKYTPKIRYWSEGEKFLAAETINQKFTGGTLKAIIYGNTAEMYLNDTKVFGFSFEKDLYIYKGVLQGVGLVNSAAFVWTQITYQKEADVVESVSIRSSSTTAIIGDMITFALTYNPSNCAYRSITWYVNGNAITHSELSYTITTTEIGLLKVSATIDGVSSPNAYVNVKAKEKEPDTQSSGCSGSIVGTGIITVLSMLGLILISKKKHQVK